MQPSAMMQRCGGTRRDWGVRRQAPWLPRLLGKFVLDILPAGLASAIGGVLLTQYQLGHQAAPRPAEQAQPASAELMAMVRDEHAMIMNYLNSQMAAERNRDAAEDADSARAAAEATATATADAKAVDQALAVEPAMPHSAPNPAAAKANHIKTPLVAASPHAPLVIAQVQQVGAVAPGDGPASDPGSLFAKTLDMKDHVVAATRHVVSAIGEAFASVGERIAGVLPGGRQFGSS